MVGYSDLEDLGARVWGFVRHDHILNGSPPKIIPGLGICSFIYSLIAPVLILVYYSRLFVNFQGRTYCDWESSDVKHGFAPPPSEGGLERECLHILRYGSGSPHQHCILP